MKNTTIKILTVFTIISIIFSSCEENLNRVVKKKYPNGQEWIVFYYNGEPSKETWVRAEHYYDNGQMMNIRRFKKGIQSGIAESYYIDGSEMAKIVFKDGKKIGYYYKKHQNGKIAYTGDYKNNFKDGKWIMFDEKGDTVKIEVYNEGRLLDSKNFNTKNTK
jgi:antitoxin component YwqK of YwqJK toxin-antitoxin module